MCPTSACTRGARTSWTARTITVTDARAALLLLIVLLPCLEGAAQGVRERIRSSPRGTVLTDAQASDLTLTLTAATARIVQTWVRTAATVDASGRMLVASVSRADGALVKAGQRARAFSPSSKSSMYQARITRVGPAAGSVRVEALLTASGRQDTPYYVLEIVVEQGPFLAIPNEAIIEEGARHVVYVQDQPGRYAPHEIQIGIQGELLTQVTAGLAEGDQVVTFGSFFIDAEQKLKGTTQDIPASAAP